MLTPGVPTDYMQVTDVRDLAAWYTHIAESRLSGAYHAVGPVLRWGETLERIRGAVASDARFTWVDADFLLAKGQKPWTDIPLWWPARNDWGVPSFDGNTGGEGALALEGSLARANGLTNRTIEDTATSTLAWYRKEYSDWPEAARPGWSAAKERELLESWRAR